MVDTIGRVCYISRPDIQAKKLITLSSIVIPTCGIHCNNQYPFIRIKIIISSFACQFDPPYGTSRIYHCNLISFVVDEAHCIQKW